MTATALEKYIICDLLTEHCQSRAIPCRFSVVWLLGRQQCLLHPQTEANASVPVITVGMVTKGFAEWEQVDRLVCDSYRC